MAKGELDPSEKIPIKWKEKDKIPFSDVLRGELNTNQWFNIPYLRGVDFVTQEQVRNFCSGCDNFRQDEKCNLFSGEENQPRYVARQWCGWAKVNGLRGEMTSKGFITGSIQPKSEEQ